MEINQNCSAQIFDTCDATRSGFLFNFAKEILPHKHTHNHLPTKDSLTESRIYKMSSSVLLCFFSKLHLKSQEHKKLSPISAFMFTYENIMEIQISDIQSGEKIYVIFHQLTLYLHT